jgi:hypothetical protein
MSKMNHINNQRPCAPEPLNEIISLSEAELQGKIVEPLLRALGFENVKDNSGPDEKGKDLVATKVSEFGRIKLYGIQIKKKKLTGNVNSKTSLGNLFVQLHQARKEEVIDPFTNIKRIPDVCIFITPYPIAPNVWEKFLNLYKDIDSNNIEIIDGSRLFDLIRNHLPNFMENFSMEVQYRYFVESSLNRIPESRLAFGLSNELKLDDIYVDTFLSNSDSHFDLMTTQPISCKPKILIANHSDIKYLKKFSIFWGAAPIIEDPPKVTTKEEKQKVETLNQDISEYSDKKVIKLNIEPLAKKMQERIRKSISNFLIILGNNQENKYNEAALDLILIHEKLRELKNFGLIWNNWLKFVDSKSKPEWQKPNIHIPSSCLYRLNCNKYILGGPGAGKTTLLRRLAQQLTRGSTETLPIFVPLILVLEPSRNAFIQSCIQELQNQGYKKNNKVNLRDHFLSQVTLGRFQLFLDGLDEVGSLAPKLMKVIEEFAFDYPKCLIVLSCRSNIEAPHFMGALTLILNPLTDKQIENFLKSWFSSEPTSLLEINAWLKSNKRMHKAAENPLILALLCSLYHLGSELPSTEVELYEQRVDLLLGKWEQAKGISRLTGNVRKCYWKFLTELAFLMHMNESRFVSLSHAKTEASSYYSKKFHHEPFKMVMDCIHRGILEFDHQGKLSFGHLSYQEYFVSRKLLLDIDTKFILGKITNPWWSNAIRFFATQKGDLSSLVRSALSEKVSMLAAKEILMLVKLSPWTDQYLIDELNSHIDLMME